MKVNIAYLFLSVSFLFACKKEKLVTPEPVITYDVVTTEARIMHDTSFCVSYSKQVKLYAPSIDSSVTSFVWYPGGSTAPSKLFTQAGNYGLILYKPTGTDTLSIIISECNDNRKGVIYVPNSFIPSGKGLNATWAPKGTGIVSIYFEIRNKEGVIVYTSDSMDKPWNGEWKGTNRLGPAGFYLYYIEYTDLDGASKKAKGALEMIL